MYNQPRRILHSQLASEHVRKSVIVDIVETSTTRYRPCDFFGFSDGIAGLVWVWSVFTLKIQGGGEVYTNVPRTSQKNSRIHSDAR
jgi:hypothetical protein